MQIFSYSECQYTPNYYEFWNIFIKHVFILIVCDDNVKF